MLEDVDMLQGLTTIIMTLGLFILKDFKGTIEKVQMSITELNVNITMLIEKDHHNQERISSNNEYIRKNQDEIQMLRNKYHDLVNNHISKIQLLDLKVHQMEKDVSKVNKNN